MRKIKNILITLLLFAFSINSFGGNILYLKLNNSVSDYLGNYTPTEVGTVSYSSTIYKTGGYAFETSGQTNTNCVELPLQVITDLSSKSSYSMSWDGYHKTGQRWAFYVSKGVSLGANQIWFYTDRDSDVLTFRFYSGASYDVSAFNHLTEMDTWINWAFVYNSGNLKVYKNNVEIVNYGGMSNSLAGDNTKFYVGGTGAYTTSHSAIIDNFVITDDEPASFPIPEPTGELIHTSTDITTSDDIYSE